MHLLLNFVKLNSLTKYLFGFESKWSHLISFCTNKSHVWVITVLTGPQVGDYYLFYWSFINKPHYTDYYTHNCGAYELQDKHGKPDIPQNKLHFVCIKFYEILTKIKIRQLEKPFNIFNKIGAKLLTLCLNTC